MSQHTFWAKTHAEQPGASIEQHALNTAAVCRALYPYFLQYMQDGREPFATYLAAIHDVGKISPQFQAKCAAWLQRTGLEQEAHNNAWLQRAFSHAKMSHEALEYFWQAQGTPLTESHTLWAAVVGAHHGKIARPQTDVFSSDGRPPAMPPSPSLDWLAAQRRFLEQQWRACGCPPVPSTADAAALWLTAGLITLADWIASDERFFSAAPDTSLCPADGAADTAAAQAVSALGLVPLPVTRGLSFADIFGYAPYPMQQAAWEHITAPGVYIIEAPMGMGKTEAALMAAYKLMETGQAQGLYFGLPTQATSNRIFLRVQHFAQTICPGSIPAQLIHGTAWLHTAVVPPHITSPGTAALDAQHWFTSPRRALLAPVGVGTADQALMAALAVRHFALRRLALAHKVVILDEVHSYDFYTRGVIQKLCALLMEMGSTVIILSATLTAEARESLLFPHIPLRALSSETGAALPYPLLSCHRHRPEESRDVPSPAPADHTVDVHFAPEQEALRAALHCARAGGQVLWICNTVAAAQHIFLHMRDLCAAEQTYAPTLGILHARLPFFLRQAREEYWMQRLGKDGPREGGSILVSTQVVEQSVDVDADLLITELAPTDMLLQRMGRLWRHARGTRPCEKPCVYILEENATLDALRSLPTAQIEAALGSKRHVYDPFILLRTLEVWTLRQTVALPSDIRGLIQNTYTEPQDIPASWQALYDVNFSTRTAHKILARMNTDIWRQAVADAEDAAPTRLIKTQDYSLVLYTASKNGRITLLDGTVIGTPKAQFDLETARALHRNALNVPEYRFTNAPSSATLQHYGLQGWAGVQGRTISLQAVKDNHHARWDAEAGILWTTERTSV